jgi:hypothetical protein
MGINLMATYENLCRAGRDYGWVVEMRDEVISVYDNIYSFICRYIITPNEVKVTKDNLHSQVPRNTDVIWKFIE